MTDTDRLLGGLFYGVDGQVSAKRCGACFALFMLAGCTVLAWCGHTAPDLVWTCWETVFSVCAAGATFDHFTPHQECARDGVR